MGIDNEIDVTMKDRSNSDSCQEREGKEMTEHTVLCCGGLLTKVPMAVVLDTLYAIISCYRCCAVNVKLRQDER